MAPFWTCCLVFNRGAGQGAANVCYKPGGTVWLFKTPYVCYFDKNRRWIFRRSVHEKSVALGIGP